MVGVLQGQGGGGICSVDCDTEEGFQAFKGLNPKLLPATLVSQGARGGNVWFRLRGDYPKSVPITDADGQPWGEWRADGNQTIILGTHPSPEKSALIAC